VNEDTFDALRDIAEERDLSLSAVFRDYVDSLVAHDGKVRVVPENQAEPTDGEEFPPKVEVSKSFVREHERLELEAQHLRDQLRAQRATSTTSAARSNRTATWRRSSSSKNWTNRTTTNRTSWADAPPGGSGERGPVSGRQRDEPEQQRRRDPEQHRHPPVPG